MARGWMGWGLAPHASGPPEPHLLGAPEGLKPRSSSGGIRRGARPRISRAHQDRRRSLCLAPGSPGAPHGHAVADESSLIRGALRKLMRWRAFQVPPLVHGPCVPGRGAGLSEPLWFHGGGRMMIKRGVAITLILAGPVARTGSASAWRGVIAPISSPSVHMVPPCADHARRRSLTDRRLRHPSRRARHAAARRAAGRARGPARPDFGQGPLHPSGRSRLARAEWGGGFTGSRL